MRSVITVPRQGFLHAGKRAKHVLLLCFYDPAGISTVPETVACLQHFSRYAVSVVNLAETRDKDAAFLTLPASFDLSRFDALLIHNSVSYNPDNLRALDSHIRLKIKKFPGVKLLFKQDENYRFREIADYIGDVKFDAVFTCLPPEAIDQIYPAERVGRVRFERMLTGYVTPRLRQLSWQLAQRPIDIGYRGSIQPLDFGRLAYEKRQIGEDVTKRLSSSGLHLDISSRWEDRFGGDQWFNFLGRCKATLGAESGASLFDLDGDLASRCQALRRTLGPEREDAAYAESFLDGLSDLEGNVAYAQISPRHFEAAATGTLQLLYPGEYSGILVAHRHYFPLARDYSNLDEAVALLSDEKRRHEMVACARSELIDAPTYSIEQFAARVDAVLETSFLKQSSTISERIIYDQAAKQVVLLAAHEPTLDPRLTWIAQCAPTGMNITRLGAHRQFGHKTQLHSSPEDGIYLTAERIRFDSSLELLLAGSVRATEGVTALHELMRLRQLALLSDSDLSDVTGIVIDNPRLAALRWLIGYFLDTAATLLTQAWKIEGAQAFIATDLDTMIPGLLLKSIYGVPLIYDAHEYWPEADPDACEAEVAFFRDLEARLVGLADVRQTVSEPLAALMSERYGVTFTAVPNCETLQTVEDASLRHDINCRFLFQGGIAPWRGLDTLISVWPQTLPQAELWIRGPDNAYKETLIRQAEETGLLNSRIFFPPAVRENELIIKAREADVGLIPYPPRGINYTYCCPNKTSQYMAAGLPILANDTVFVRSIIERSNAGLVVRFEQTRDLIAAVNRLTEDRDARQRLAAAGQYYYRHHFHWEKVSESFYHTLSQWMEHAQPCILRIHNIGITSDAETSTLAKSGTVFQQCLGYVRRFKVTLFIRKLSIMLLQKVWHALPSSTRHTLRPLAVWVCVKLN